MHSSDPSKPVDLEFDPTTVQKVLLTIMVLSFAVAILSALGEFLGWWNDMGEVGMITGTVVGALAGVTALTTGATKRQTAGIASGVGVANGKLDRIDLKLGKLDKLDQLDHLDKLDELDVIPVTLDHQTGVLDRQLAVLEQVRDRL